MQNTTNIEKISQIIKDFIKKNIGQDSKIIGITKSNDGWLGKAEVYEESSFIKALGLHTKVQDRHVYEVQLTEDLEVVSYSRKDLISK